MALSFHSVPAEIHLQTTRLKFRRILVATDFSSYSDAALFAACHLARVYQGELVIFHNIVPPVITPDATLTTIEAASAACAHAEKRMAAQTSAHAELTAVPHRIAIREGSLNDELAKVIKREAIDLLVVGSHGARGFEKVLLGSVAESMLRKSPIPVMVIGPQAKVSETPTCILLATDLEPAALHAAQYATSLAEEFQAKLTLLHVLQQPGWPTSEEREAIEHRLQQLVPADATAFCQAGYRVRHGEPSREIVAQAQQCEANLIVTGRHNKGPLSSRALWTTLTRLIQEAPCPVLTVR